MKIEVKLFAVARQLAGSDTAEVEMADDATVADLKTALAEQHPPLAPLVSTAMFAVDTEYATDDTPLAPEQEIACIPPVSGG